jgi:hypothetical protein
MFQKRVSINCSHPIDVISVVIRSDLHLNYRISEILFILFKYIFELKGRNYNFRAYRQQNSYNSSSEVIEFIWPSERCANVQYLRRKMNREIVGKKKLKQTDLREFLLPYSFGPFFL